MADGASALKFDEKSTKTQDLRNTQPEPVETSENTGQMTVEKLAAGMAQKMPKAQSYVDTQPEASDLHTPKPPVDVDPALKDRYGRAFNPKYHAVGPNGQPKITRTGKLTLKRETKNGRKQAKKNRLDARRIKSDNISDNNEPVIPAENSPNTESKDVNTLQRKAASTFFVAMAVNIGVGIFGDEWRAEKNEFEMMDNAMTAYLNEVGMEDLPAGWALVGAMGAYALPRLAKPKTQSVFSRLIQWCKARIIELKTGNKFAVTPKQPSQSVKKQEVQPKTRAEYENETKRESAFVSMPAVTNEF